MSSGKGSLAADVADLLSAEEVTLCAVGRAVEQFAGEDRASLIRLIDETDIAVVKIRTLFAKHGLDVGVGRLWNHRRRLKKNETGCSCPVNP